MALAIKEVPVIFSLELVTVPVADVDRAKGFYPTNSAFGRTWTYAPRTTVASYG
jgi:hypothetical protein